LRKERARMGHPASTSEQLGENLSSYPHNEHRVVWATPPSVRPKARGPSTRALSRRLDTRSLGMTYEKGAVYPRTEVRGFHDQSKERVIRTPKARGPLRQAQGRLLTRALSRKSFDRLRISPAGSRFAHARKAAQARHALARDDRGEGAGYPPVRGFHNQSKARVSTPLEAQGLLRQAQGFFGCAQGKHKVPRLALCLASSTRARSG
jgi:hypothetical protein